MDTWQNSKIKSETVEQSKDDIGFSTDNKMALTNEQAPKLRQNMIQSAITFLSNPKVTQQSEEKKCGFLRSKGLTEEEIKFAFSECSKQVMAHYPYVHQDLQIPPRCPIEPTIFTYARNSLPFFVILSGLGFSCQYVYLKYIRPYLTGEKPVEPKNNLMTVEASILTAFQNQERSLSKLSDNITQTNDLLKTLLQKQNTADTVLRKQMDNLETNVLAIKNMSLSRKSFSSIPSAAGLPDWQMLPKVSKSTPEVVATSSVSSTDIDKDESIASNGV